MVAASGLAPYGAEGLDWFAGMAEGGVAALTAATERREVKERRPGWLGRAGRWR